MLEFFAYLFNLLGYLEMSINNNNNVPHYYVAPFFATERMVNVIFGTALTVAWCDGDFPIVSQAYTIPKFLSV